ncbi:GAF domain-containing protein [Geomonas sp. Red69]|uniref:histidine kinase n=1 Tax=Geomonas diazotrophica TaxID=2843197 RepID=A0ABX8JI70_9BACT|nr:MULTISPECIES: GAF domain-containing sensor histidine kinase [Geomonas]MBU5638409.1 GAF domain-containing protein [Geomonas diazotrophica]QWV97319.1 GAF domain-containing protein [Geomonas nitrogeniifigens]QXE86476.1 GAF domain-containing protein [Geomonas nitrogeniifigens]
MAARKGNNLLEQALRVAQSSGRSHQGRLRGLLRLAARTPGIASAALFLPDSTEPALTVCFSSLLSGASRSCLIPYGQGCAGRAAAELRDVYGTSVDLHPEERGSGEAGQFAAIPILDGTGLAAILALACPDPELPAESLALCRQLVPIFSLTLSGLAVEQEAHKARRNLSLLSSLGQLLSAPTPAAILLPQVVKLCTASGLAGCAVIRLSPKGRNRNRVYKGCHSSARRELTALLEFEQRFSARALAAGATRTDKLPLPGACRYALCAPLSCNGQHLGALSLFGGGELLAPEQAELAETVARLVAGALTEAICEERVASFDTENEKKLKELSLLYRLSNTMLSTIKLNKLIHLTLTALTSGPTPFFDRAMLFLANERSGSLVGMLGVTSENAPPLSMPQGGGDDLLSSRWDITEDEMAAQRESEFSRQVQGKRLELDPTLNIASQAVLERRLIYIPEETGIGSDASAVSRTALAASPLIAHGQTVGVVLVDNALTLSPITQEHLRFLQLFTNQAGMAIENSMLYNKVEDAHRQLSEAQESLLQKERLATIGEMAAGIAHELKGPLVSIGGFAGRLARKLPPESSEWASADLIVREVIRLEGILSEILLFSKKTTICYTRCNVVDIVKETLVMAASTIEEKQIGINTKFPRQRQVLLGDCQQLKQVFINIIQNSLEAMPPGGQLSIQVHPSELDGKDAISVKIVDTGGGIPLEQLNNIFTPFFTTKESGTGLGLPIANRIITNHGGKIQVTNHPGLGAEFRIVLPKHW